MRRPGGALAVAEVPCDATFVHVMTVPNSLHFLLGQTRGIELRFVTSPPKVLDRFEATEGVRVERVEMSCRITPLAGARALVGASA